MPSDLLVVYIKQYIKETYLIAAKASDKVRYIQPAQDILQLSIKVLIVWIVALILTAATVPRVLQQKSSSTASVNETVSQIAGGHPEVKSTPLQTESGRSHDKKAAVTMSSVPAATKDIVTPGTQIAKQGSTEHQEIPGEK